jgi:hypothetical protein
MGRSKLPLPGSWTIKKSSRTWPRNRDAIMTTTRPNSALTPETVGDRVCDPRDFLKYSSEAATLVRLYGEDPGITGADRLSYLAISSRSASNRT